MKQMIQLAAVLMLGILMGCSSSKVEYRSRATLSPADETGQFDVAFVIEDLSKPEDSRVISSPRLRVLKGQEGQIFIGDDKSNIVCTALVGDASGKPEVKTTVSVKKNGRIVWSEEKTVAMTE